MYLRRLGPFNFFNLIKMPLSQIIKYLFSVKFLIIVMLQLPYFKTQDPSKISHITILSYSFPLYLFFPSCTLLLKQGYLCYIFFRGLNCIPSYNLTCSSVPCKQLLSWPKSNYWVVFFRKITFFIFIDLDIFSTLVTSCYWLLVGRGQAC